MPGVEVTTTGGLSKPSTPWKACWTQRMPYLRQTLRKIGPPRKEKQLLGIRLRGLSCVIRHKLQGRDGEDGERKNRSWLRLKWRN